MKKFLIISLIALSALSAAAKKENNSEKVILTIDNTPTTVSEFEYLYNKNNSQQAVKQSPQEYMDMFVVYKLKVADAIAAGIDKSDSFRDEYDSYLLGLAAPYFVNKDTVDKIIAEAYDLTKREFDISLIAFAGGETTKERTALLARMDSVRNVINSGKATFDEMAAKVSNRPGSAHYGYITNDGYTPYPIVLAASQLKPGEVSEPVYTGFGWFLLQSHGERPASKNVLVQHILKLTEGRTEADAQRQKEKIDSIYNLLVTKKADFDQIAKRESEDPGSRNKGGRLDWFGAGKMVPEFEKASMELPVGEISKPIKTFYGYHIIHKIDERDSIPYEEIYPRLESIAGEDQRLEKMRNDRIEKLRAESKETVNKKLLEEIAREIDLAGGADSAVIAKLSKDTRKFATYVNDYVTVGEVVSKMPRLQKMDGKMFTTQMNGTFEVLFSRSHLDKFAANQLYASDAGFRNLANEYHDGILLYEISNRNVWEKSTEDKNGLENYFRKNIKKYQTWTKPRFKGYVVFATSDSVAALAKELLEKEKIAAADALPVLRKAFGKEIRIERVIAEKGRNAIIDYIAFNGAKPAPVGKWVAYFAYESKLLDQPEEALDVRGEVTSDYQNELEKEWVKELKKKHKVKINTKLLNKISQ